MNNKTLMQLYVEHKGKVSDKWSIYLAEYDRIFSSYRDNPIKMLEIGIQNGGSLEIWAKYFKNAQKLVGCDINADCSKLIFDNSIIVVVVGDANSDDVQQKLLGHASNFDLIVDDGSHRSSDIVRSFARYFPYLSDGGVFVAEDLHCSYWQEFEGGLFDPYSSVAFFKRLADIVNHEHWGIPKSRVELLSGLFSRYDFEIDEDLLSHVHAVEFINSMCVIRKANPIKNLLGTRFISGLDESVVPGGLALQSTTTPEPSQLGNIWTARTIPPDEDILRLEEELVELGKSLAKSQDDFATLSGSNSLILNSLSWKITKPLRFFREKIRGIVGKIRS